ncbi:hypothetical protein EVJ50_05460 [Synechococcus sp. RSCCF101]|uniref:hypothetical protein n=1 Tax=Synechococcus sp. RSCCF101 TaxID=2511069 RepID=UPI0012491794|nr:hypothetical protein [Synechococcus sp. RSCCF101]QEY31777.1 hypothetical protein EVJ50_05460 [Synechococcus sp. RSCCF101]
MESAPPPIGLYGLAGSGLPWDRPAGLPALHELLEHGPAAPIWILYAPPQRAIEVLTARRASIGGWLEDLHRAARLKSLWSERVSLVNVAQIPSGQQERLHRELPEYLPMLAPPDAPSSHLVDLIAATALSRSDLAEAWEALEELRRRELDLPPEPPAAPGLADYEAILRAQQQQQRAGVAREEELDNLRETSDRLRLELESVRRLNRRLEEELEVFAEEHERCLALSRRIPPLLDHARRRLEGDGRL